MIYLRSINQNCKLLEDKYYPEAKQIFCCTVLYFLTPPERFQVFCVTILFRFLLVLRILLLYEYCGSVSVKI